jgi:putative hydrolase of HD superfamily
MVLIKEFINQRKLNDIMEKLLDAVYKLKKLKRTGWEMVGIQNGESVAEHSYAIIILALMYAEEFGCEKDKLVKMALIHDLGESRIGDLVTDIGNTEVLSKAEKEKIETEAVKDLVEGNQELVKLYLEFIEGNTKEARILSQLDKYEMMLQAFEYEKAGDVSNEKIQEFWDYADSFFKGKELEKLYLKLKSERSFLSNTK